MNKTYLGDGVYAEQEEGMIKLSVDRSDGEHYIFLGITEMEALINYYKNLTGQIPS